MKRIMIITMMIYSMFTSCRHEDEFHHYAITFYNNSAKDIYVNSTVYPDTSGGLVYDVTCQPSRYKIAAHSINNTALERRDCYESFMRFSHNGYADTLIIYVFDADIFEANKRIDHYKAVLQRIDLNIDDLRKSNWTVSYPYK